MRLHAIGLLTLAIYATGAVVPVMTAAGGETSSRHIRKHHARTSPGWNRSSRRSWAAEQIRPVAPSWSGGGSVCPGLARSFDCKIWPPPFDDDPDRKASGADAGG
jgi:hypothetical protein